MPGPPFGPSMRTTMTWPFLTLSLRMALQRGLFGLEHDGLACELEVPSLPLILPTAPSGAEVAFAR